MSFFFPNFTSYLELNKALSTAFPLTFVCWFAPVLESGGSLRSLLSISNNSGAANRHFTLENNFNSGVIRARQINIVATTVNLAKPQTPQWHHGAAVFVSDSDRTAFLDGIGVRNTDGTIANTGLAVTNIAASYVFSASANQIYQGLLYDAAFYQAALSASEILDLALGRKRPLDVRPGSLLAYCPLDKDFYDIAKGNVFTAPATQPIFSQYAPPILAPRFLFNPRTRLRSGLLRDEALFVGGGVSSATRVRVINVM